LLAQSYLISHLFARQLVQHIGHSDLDITGMVEKFNELKAAKGAEPLTPEDYASLIAPFLPTLRALQNVKLPGWKQVLAFFQQAALIDWGSVTTGPDHKRLVIPLANVLTVDSMALDLRFGVCPIPLYEFMPEDWEKLLSGTALGDIEERLKALGIYQYFFPPPDQIALGVADRSRATIKTISSSIQLAPELGHPLGIPELVQGGSITEIVNQLQERGLLVEGEVGMEVTPAGTNARASVKFRPREGLVSKLIQRFTVNLSTTISPKDFG
jgi:hypothetical protein